MTREEGIILSAYTGYLLVDSFDPVHEFVEKLLGRPVWTHEFADRALLKEIQGKCKHLLPAVKEEPRWIPVAERLPEPNKWMLCLCRANIIEVLKYDPVTDDWDTTMPNRCYMKSFVTHWMPLPEPPKEV